MDRIKWIATVLASALVIFPGTALAQGGAAADQYTEQVPNADGSNGGGSPELNASEDTSSGGEATDSDSDPSPTSPATSSSDGGPINSATADKFNKNEDGDKAANLAEQTAPQSEALKNAAEVAQSGGTTDSGVFDTPSDTASSDDGMGIALPIILAVVLLGGIAFAWSRRRRDPDDPGTSTGLRDRFRRPSLSERN